MSSMSSVQEIEEAIRRLEPSELEAFRAWFAEFDAEAPDVLYHYTDQRGFLGVLDSRVLWATKIQYLNDAAELVVPLRTAANILREKEAASNLPQSQREGLQSEHVGVGVVESANINIPVVSFCEDGDKLSMWRAYSRDGIGYAIGFDRHELATLCDSRHVVLRKCEYPRADEYRKKIDDLICEYISSPRLGTGRLAFELITKSSTMKDHSFHEEKEWRIVPDIRSTSDLMGCTYLTGRFRSGKSMIVPYWHFRLAEPQPSIVQLPIKRVIIGPTPHRELAHEAVKGRLLAGDLNLGGVQVENSRVPYRNW